MTFDLTVSASWLILAGRSSNFSGRASQLLVDVRGPHLIVKLTCCLCY